MNETELKFDDLLTEVSLSETSRSEFVNSDADVPQELDSNLDIFAEIESVPVEVQPQDTTDYSVPEGCPYLIIERPRLNHILSQLTSIIDLNSTRAVSRGITFTINSPTELNITCPNDLYYFTAKLNTTTTFEQGTNIYLEYQFIQHIAKFIPSKVLIYKKEDTYFIRLITGDLELINTQLLESDIKRLTYDYEVTDQLIQEIPHSDLVKLNTMYKLMSFEADTPRRQLNGNDTTTFRSAQLFTSSQIKLPNIKLNQKVCTYLIKLASLLGKDDVVKIYNTTSDTIIRYALVYDNITMITNYAVSQEDATLTKVFAELPDFTVIDYPKLKYNLEYANAITYALGLVILINKDNTLQLQIKLQNGNTSKVDIACLSPITIEQNKEIKLSTKSLLNLLNALNPSQPTKVGFKDGVFYIVNTDVDTGLVVH